MLKIITLVLCSTATSFAAVVSNTNISLSSGGGVFPPFDYQLTIQQFATTVDPTSIFLDREGENLIFGGRNLDE
jgi:hypothetical protein